MIKFFIIIVSVLLFLGAANATLAAGPTFTPEQLALLKATGRDIIVPLYLPAGSKVKKVMTDRKHPKTPSYAILFVSSGNACFVIEMGTEIGDMIVENDKGDIIEPTSEIKNPALGAAPFWNTPEYLGTDWFPLHKNAAYCIKGNIDQSMFSTDKTALTICKKRLDSAEFIKVAKSLGILHH
jgi:hypothetical protein